MELGIRAEQRASQRVQPYNRLGSVGTRFVLASSNATIPSLHIYKDRQACDFSKLLSGSPKQNPFAKPVAFPAHEVEVYVCMYIQGCSSP